MQPAGLDPVSVERGGRVLIRDYDKVRDTEAIRRIWREIGWLDQDKDHVLDLIVGAGRAQVAEIEGDAECLAMSAPGTVRYLSEDLSFAAITGVTTSRVARKRRLAQSVLARLVAVQAIEGALVVGLGMFEQGFYDRLGFGTGGYEHSVAFDPSHLKVDVPFRVPRRIDVSDRALLHSARLSRRRLHGAVTLWPAALTHADMLWTRDGFGLGYCDGPDGAMTHYVGCGGGAQEHGPYHAESMAYQTREQFLELLALMRSWGDQVRMITLEEPPGIQLQDLVDQPFARRLVSRGWTYSTGTRARAWRQMRICDVPGCLARTCVAGGAVSINLSLCDPIATYLDESSPWRGGGLCRDGWALVSGRTRFCERPSYPERDGERIHKVVARRGPGDGTGDDR